MEWYQVLALVFCGILFVGFVGLILLCFICSAALGAANKDEEDMND